MFKSLSGRFLILTILFVMLAEVAIFVPSVARFREDYLLMRLERAQIASLALLADDMISPDLETELLSNAGVFNVVLRRDSVRQLVLASELPAPISHSFDMRGATAWTLIWDALARLGTRPDQVIRVIGSPSRNAGELIEITMPTAPLRAQMIEYGGRVLLLSAVISAIVATLLFGAVQVLIVRPIRSVIGAMQTYAAAPEDIRHVITPASTITELREAEDALQVMQTDLTAQLRQKDRLAQLGAAVAKISHDLRNILTSAQLFTDRIETSDDPVVQRLAPKLVGSISRAVSLCETTLAFGRAEEAAPRLSRFPLAPLVDDVFDAEQLASGDHHIRFAHDIPAGYTLRADPEQLHRVLFNLVRNARQAIEASGQSGDIHITATEDDTRWVIHIRDTGPGLPPRAQEKLFTPFQSAARKGGSGLGLAIADELVRGHGGQIDLLSTSGSGTEFGITLPK